MKITGKSTFHHGVQITLIGVTEGINIKKLRGPRNRYCLDYSNNNSHVCGCGFPVARIEWEIPEGYKMKSPPCECGVDGNCYKTGYIVFEIIKV